MKKIFLISFIALFIFSSCTQKEEKISKMPEIIPIPLKMEMKKGQFIIDQNTNIFALTEDEIQIAKIFSEQIKLISGLDLQIVKEKPNSNFISFSITENKELGKEAYQLKADKNSVEIQANFANGLFYSVQTLFQILPVEVFGNKLAEDIELTIPAMEITDKPRFEYRGMHLDVSRHFFPVKFIKKYIDIIAMHKMNTFHWHLVDDQGWRVEIKKYPKLTEIGSKRIDREDKNWRERDYEITGDTTFYEGFYSQNDIREIVQYAKERFVTVIPEIEMPAHVMSAIAAYPELSCSHEQIEVPSGSIWPITEIYCAGNEEVFTFNENVLSEIMELFPSKYIHIGGDEATKTNWKTCPKCQKRIKDEKLADVKELQSYFIRRIEKFILSKGRLLIGWDEILEGGLAPEATVMSWRGMQGGIEAAKAGHNVIMTPGSHCYFDHYQGNPKTEPLAIGGYTSLKKVYSFKPIPEELSETEAKHILGAQANLWTEYMYDGNHVEYMTMPRIAALAEVNWSAKEQRNWLSFRDRMQTQFKRYSARNYNFSKGTNLVDINIELSDKKALVELYSEQLNTEIRYTLDGSEPNAESLLYIDLLLIEKETTIKAIIFKDGKQLEGITEKVVNPNDVSKK